MAHDHENNNQDDQTKLEQAPAKTTAEGSKPSLREQVLASFMENAGNPQPVPPKPTTVVPDRQPEPLEQEELAVTSFEPPFEQLNEQPSLEPETPDYGDSEVMAEPLLATSPLPLSGRENEPAVEQPVHESRVNQMTAASPRKQESRRRKDRRQKESSLVTKIVAIVVIGLIIMMTALGFSFYRYWQAGLQPLNAADDKLIQVEIPIGSGSKQIGAILEQDKIIKSGLVFTFFVKTHNLANFKAGFYQMSPAMTLDEIGTLLQEGGTEEPQALADAQILITEGSSLDQIADVIATKTGATQEDFFALIKDEDFFKRLLEKFPELLKSVKDAKDVRYRLEGYLFPATYNYYKDQTLEALVTEMVAKTNSIVTPRIAEANARNLTVQQLLTLASLVEREGSKEEDRRNIAQVFFNRIEEKMPLQSDISILYAMNEHKVHLSNKDTQIDSPYNLYINTGYGPGPFNSPSEAAIDAVLYPTKNDYIYFLADVTTGEVYFAKTYEEHLALKEKYIDNLQ